MLVTAAAPAQGFRVDLLAPPGPILTQAAVSPEETVRLLTGLAKIQSDMILGLLFLQDGISSTGGSHFSAPRAETYPGLKDGLLAAGAVDFEPQLIALEAGGDKEAVLAAYAAANVAVIQARSILRATSRDLLQSIVEQTRAAAAEINPEGPTEVASYQDAWAMTMVARSQVDLLLFSGDGAVIKAANQMALTLDDVILYLPDPSVGTPVELDASVLLEALTVLEGLAGSV
jgi:hypothetical protein